MLNVPIKVDFGIGITRYGTSSTNRGTLEVAELFLHSSEGIVGGETIFYTRDYTFSTDTIFEVRVKGDTIQYLIDNVVSEISNGVNFPINYKLGVMVETPRAALKADELAKISSFLSFGTNDLTQMTYGLSRDDSGTFMRDYLEREIFPVDPFRSLDLDGVGELLKIASKKSRDANPSIKIGICGEHGGDPGSIVFCKTLGLDYVSCSPYRIPIARLAAAQVEL